MHDNDLGESIEIARLKRGWTQAAVAEKIGVSPRTVSHWETGTRQPKVENRKKLMVLLGPLDAALAQALAHRECENDHSLNERNTHNSKGNYVEKCRNPKIPKSHLNT